MSNQIDHTEEIDPEESFEAYYNREYISKAHKIGDVVPGKVISITDNFVIVDAGLKSESYISSVEFSEEEDEVNVGDIVDVAIESFEDGCGETKLSREKARRIAAWNELEKAIENGSVVVGTVVCKVKGGFTVYIKGGIKAFLPGSLIDIKPVRDGQQYEGKSFDFKVIKFDRKRNNVVLSRRGVIEENISEERQNLIDSLCEGLLVKGVVKNITEYGAFIDFGGIDGLLHITDIAWRRIRHPGEILSIGDEITAKILKFDKERQRVSLGIKQLGDDPWIGLSSRYPTGTKLKGRVTNITDYGAFIEIENGIEGLVHVSEIDWTNKNIHPTKVMQLGDEIEVVILDVCEERRRISLGMKQCKFNPWKEFAKSYSKGDVITGAIKSITDFGIFIGLPGGIDGLIHIADLASSDMVGDEAIKKYKKGDQVEAKIILIDVDRERISLSIKMLNISSLETLLLDHPIGSQVEGMVLNVESKTVTVMINEELGVTGLLTISNTHPRLSDMRESFNISDIIKVYILSADKESNSIMLTQKNKDTAKAEAKEELATSSTNLGDILKAEMAKDK